MINEKDVKPMFLPPVRPQDHGWIKQDGVLYELYQVREYAHEGHSWLMAYGKNSEKIEGEWISHDDGHTWEDPDMAGYW